MVMKIKGMMSLLEKKGVRVCGTTDDFFSTERDNKGIWVSAESTPELFDYYNSDWMDTFGVNPKINKVIEKNGWWCEWYDSGTMMVWPS